MIGKVSTAWAGTSGGPGVTQMYFDQAGTFGAITATQAQSAVNAVRTYWAALTSLLPDEIILTVSAVVDQYDPVTGTLTGSVTAATPPASVQGAGTGVFSMASGVRVNLQTGVVRNGRRVRGSQFIVPAISTAFSVSGTVASANRTLINNAGTQMLNSFGTAGLRLLVWSRPVPADRPHGPRSGDVAAITAFDTSEKGGILRGRRD